MNREILDNQYIDINWDKSSGITPEELEQEVIEMEKSFANKSKSFIKAKTFELLLEKGQIAVLKEDIFQEKLNVRWIMNKQRDRWWKNATENFKEKKAETEKAEETKLFSAHEDFGHTTANTKMLIDLGFCGLIEQLEKAESEIIDISEKQKDFYLSSKIAISAMANFCLRLSHADGITKENGACLKNISKQAPSSFYEALQMLIVYFYLHERVAAARMRNPGQT